MRLVLAGTPEVALPTLDALLDSDHEVVGVLTRPDAPSGRGRTLRPSPVAARALEAGLPVLRPEHPREPECVAALTELAPDCVPVVAYGALVPQSLLDLPPHGWLNLHFSLLPRWRGAAPVQHAIAAGDDETGACVFRLVRQLDAGPVLATERTRIAADETAGALLERLAISGARLLVESLDALAAGTAHATDQPAEGVTLAPKITPADARIDWHADETTIDRRIRACTPAPGAWTTWRGERFKIAAARPAAGAPLSPGVLQVAPGGRRVEVGTGGRPLELLTVQPPGKRAMAAADWARGAALTAGEALA